MENIPTVDQTLNKDEKYRSLYPQVKALIAGETDLIANLANIASALKYSMNFFWVGFYLVKDDSLVLGPFQGPVACTRIRKGKGVCGRSWETGESIVVPDVDKFPGHIACSTQSRSEIVIPVQNHDNKVIMILDVDSDQLDHFDEIDREYLEKICNLIR